ncbi:MAG: glycosyltransferase [Solirubrobacteraceae bacterium]
MGSVGHGILLVSPGSRGDVQPFVALALGLDAAGHQVTVAAPEKLGGLVEGVGVRFVPLAVDFAALSDRPELTTGNPLAHPRAVRRTMREVVMPMMRRMLDGAADAAEGAQAIVHHPKLMGGDDLAAAHGVPGIAAATLPLLSPTSAFPPPGVINRDLGAWLNRASYRLLPLMNVAYSSLLRDWRRERLGLRKPAATAGRLRLYCYSPAVVPTPADWDETSIATGYWELPQTSLPPPPDDLAAFLSDGTAPVTVGFGSMIGTDPARITATVVAALRRAGRRGVLITGGGGLLADAVTGDDVIAVPEVPHAWLFERVAAVVHHGGAGTTGAGLRAGRPTVVCPFIGDQPFWARAVYERGAGPAPLPATHLEPESLHEAILRATTDPEIARRVGGLGEQLRTERGVARAVRAIQDRLAATGA